jgi:hypothetical protein
LLMYLPNLSILPPSSLWCPSWDYVAYTIQLEGSYQLYYY